MAESNDNRQIIEDTFENIRPEFELPRLAEPVPDNFGEDQIRQPREEVVQTPDGNVTSLPQGKGFKMINALFKRDLAQAKATTQTQSKDQNLDIYTDHVEALKTALEQMGVQSDRNPGGLPIEVDKAKRIWFGNNSIDAIKESEFRSKMESGEEAIDPKRVRKFVNYDGSQTWEILNEDKTVMSRFTMGEFKGQKIFTQGGYKKYAEVLKEQIQTPSQNLPSRFDEIRRAF